MKRKRPRFIGAFENYSVFQVRTPETGGVLVQYQSLLPIWSYR
jgi:hypothetical protein